MERLACPDCGIVHLSREDWCYIPMKSDLDALVEQGRVRLQQLNGMHLYKYGREAMWERWWTPAMLSARGVVYSRAGSQLNFVFDKFFNYEELEGAGVLPEEEEPDVLVKYDGSMISVFMHKGSWQVASSGSFNSEQAQWATELLSEYHDRGTKLLPNYQYVFELIHPENRIVVNYGDERKLVLLDAALHGERFGDHLEFLWPDVAQYVEKDPFTEVDNAEGYVLEWMGGIRAKVKFGTYKDLHRVLFNLTAKNVLDSVVEGSYDDLAAKLPEYERAWTDPLVRQFQRDVENLYIQASELFDFCAEQGMNRKQLAHHALATDYSGAVFALADSNAEKALEICQGIVYDRALGK